MSIGRAADAAEHEADRFADGVLTDLSQRPMSLQRSSHGVDELGGTYVTQQLESRIRSASGGHALPGDVQRAAQERSGRDLSGVRVHSGSDAADMSASLQATAFTVGSNVFLGADAARPGTAAGDAVLGHELGHVVQQGGGVAPQSVQRMANFAPLRSGPPTVQRLFGKSAAKKIGEKAESTGNKPARTIGELDKDIAKLEAALAKLLKHNTPGNLKTQRAASLLYEAATRVQHNLPDQKSHASKVLGRLYPEQVKRLQAIRKQSQYIMYETEETLAPAQLAASKAQAENIYLDAGRASGGDERPSGSFKNLTDAAYTFGFTAKGKTEKRAGVATEFALSEAEVAAIITFTAQDYRYMNPAAANSKSWMASQHAGLEKHDDDDGAGEDKLGFFKMQESFYGRRNAKESMKNKMEEGSLHTAMAVQGMLKLPVWSGKLYRGEMIYADKFEQRFPKDSHGGRRSAEATSNRTSIASATAKLSVAEDFVSKTADPTEKRYVVWEIDVNNGRDIQQLSVLPLEAEIATLPGAQFAITDVVEGATPKDYTLVKCRQIK